MPSGIYNGAMQRPIGLHPTVIKPRIIVIHTMDGYLTGTDSEFHANGPHGDNSHFGVGGQFDGANDGAIYQWQDCNRQANAQYAGNAYGISIETSDGTKPGTEWDLSQFSSLVKLCTWICQTFDIPAKMVRTTSDSGFAYHSQFVDWNKDSHNCPGPVRVSQTVLKLVPAVANNLQGGDDDMTPDQAAALGRIETALLDKTSGVLARIAKIEKELGIS